jgi:hypothetical protein
MEHFATLSCWDHISCFCVVSLSANDLPLIRSLPFLSVGFVACLGDLRQLADLSTDLTFPNPSYDLYFGLIIVSSKPVSQHIQIES